ncbi:uncharacterized protein LOC141538233 [Cotesia typhae]|uniref:uncharacterized protein LOC141538233 n=1 Tax=Cotesia typhae TaxID=2053667 RepID=UPI003D6916A5
MGVAKNTPEYIWRTEGGMESIMVTVRKRACMYLLDIMRMEDKRWPKVCLREECRGILNGEPSKWGKAVVMALEEMKCSDVIRMIWEKKEIAVIENRLNEEPEVQICQDVHRNGAILGWIKMVWCRMRCGNIEKSGKKGFKGWRCRLCKVEEETLEHIFRCSVMAEKTMENVKMRISEWLGTNVGADFDWLVVQTLRKQPNETLCEYISKFEKLEKEGVTGTESNQEDAVY